MNEQRYAKRVRYEYPITLTAGKKKICGIIKNISLGGLYVVLKPLTGPVKGSRVKFSIVLNPRAKSLRIEGDAKVARCAVSGSVALAFLSMNANDFTQLRRLIEVNVGSSNMGRALKKFIIGRNIAKKKGRR